MKMEITIEAIEASNDEVELKGWTMNNGKREGYSILSFPADIDIPKLGSVMVLDVTFHAPEPKFEPELMTSSTKL